MYNPFPYLPQKFQKFINLLKEQKIHSRIVFFTMGLLATIWFLIRVIPKPSRAGYPCMQATAPFMSGFVLYLTSIGGAAIAFKSLRNNLANSKYFLSLLFLVISVSLYVFSQTQLTKSSFASIVENSQNYFTPNTPIGEAQGIFPGRVTWIWDPSATNENCTNTSNYNGVIDEGDDAWFMQINNNPLVIDSMITKSLLALTGESDHSDAWEKVFRFYNSSHGNGDVGYSSGQKILIKVNATSSYGGLETGNFYADLSRNDDIEVNAFAAETNPYVVLSMIHQLVDFVEVPQEMIYVGDPARNIYKEFYDLWSSDFPDVNYLGNNLLYPEIDVVSLGRTPVSVTDSDKVYYSDFGTVMPDAISDKLFTIFDEIDYLINIPTLKAHGTAGITLAAKNHFGSFTRTWAMHLHPGLMDGVDEPSRLGYGLYRIQTDIMMHNLLSGKNLLMIVDGLYPGEDALGVPEKWSSIPFEDDWCSSIFMSLDPVAIESVCHDFLRTEYNGPTLAESRPNWFGVDDYLHQSADSSIWPEEIIYDPDGDGIIIASLGVHEHWNDSLNKQYTRNLGSGDGIELIKTHELTTGINTEKLKLNLSVYPNPVNEYITISNSEEKTVKYSISNLSGVLLMEGNIESKSVQKINLANLKSGIYFIAFHNGHSKQNIKIIKN